MFEQDMQLAMDVLNRFYKETETKAKNLVEAVTLGLKLDFYAKETGLDLNLLLECSKEDCIHDVVGIINAVKMTEHDAEIINEHFVPRSDNG